MKYLLYILPIILLKTNFCFCQTAKIVLSDLYAPTKSEEARKYYNAGSTYFDQENYAKAIQSFENAIAIDNNYIDAYDNLGLTFRHAGNLDSAEYYYLASIRKYRKGTVALRNMGVLESKRKNYTKAIDYYKQAIAVNAKDAEAYYGLTRVYSLSNNIPEALKNGHLTEQYYKETNDPNIGDCYFMLAMIYYASHDKPNSQKYLTLTQNTGMKVDQQYIDMINK